ncbi:hypothetical protein G5I_13201 [Acromyrmex echinatior]|uniref:Uncharacterized protein n=1 Tax=Acromyrmex echinatior TaxID=103372 RepID=F4X4E1_ACREC|nr:hypothetical protein G5I_13201 [Acromyrmex echinatior]
MADVREREKIAREIEKTSESIRKKHRALKTDRIEENMVLDRHFNPLTEPLRLFVDSSSVRATKRESRDEDATSASKRERKRNKRKKRTKVQNQLQTSEGREALRADLGLLGQKYVEAVLRGVQDKESGIDHVYGIYLHKDGLMFGNKRLDVDDADNRLRRTIRRYT